MIITHKLQPMDLTHKQNTSRVDIVQDDKYSRDVEFTLTENGVAWKIPDGTTAIVRYKKPDGTGGNYDTLPDGSTAYQINGNVLTVALAPQVCTVSGSVQLSVGLIKGNAEINTFSVNIVVHPNPGAEYQSEDYIKLSGAVPNSGWTPNMYLGTDAQGNVVSKELAGGGGGNVSVDSTLTKAGQAADAAVVGNRLSALSEEIDTITLGKHTDGLVYVFLNGNPIGNGLNLSDASGEQVEENLPVFANVTWDNTSYAIGNNHEHAYNAWAPNCAHYDSVVGKVMFLQCHMASHTGAFSASELIAIDPYNVMEYEVIKTFQPVNSSVPLCFTIFNGIYYIMSKNTVYTSDNHGKTWTETSIPVPLSTAYGLNIIDGVWYVGNDESTSETDGVYHVSLDNGATWETKSFNLQDYSGELTCSEASFVKWNGKIYASLRRENTNGLLVRQNEDGTWKVLTDTLPNVSSDCALSVTKDRLCYAAINRPSVQVEIGTITISDDDTVSIEPFFTKSFSEISASGDFHTPSYVYGPDFQMVTFMTNAVQPKEYNGAVNACIVGYADGVEAVGYDYDVITGHLGSNWSAEPYVGAAPDLSSGVATTVDNAVINYNGTVPTYYPSVDGDIVTFNAAANSACKTGILDNVGQAFAMPIMHALQNENGDWIACLSKKKDGAGAASLRFVAKTYKHTILSKPEIQGGTEFDCAVYKATAGSINTAYLSYPIPANLTKRLSVSG